MKAVAPTCAAVLGLPAPRAAQTGPVPEILDDFGTDNEHLVILAPDALGLYAWNLWKDHMPFLSSLHESRSIILESIMKSDTGTNFGCMLTGAEVDVHGMDNKQKKDLQSRFKCETLFDVIRSSGGESAGCGQKGHCGDVLLSRFADLAWISERGPAATVTDIVVREFGRSKPRFVLAQYGNVDRTFHKLGPSDLDVIPMLKELDAALEKAVSSLAVFDACVIILADHGQHDMDEPNAAGKWGSHGTDREEDRLVPCTWVRGAPSRFL